jgi:hypothetical protein
MAATVYVDTSDVREGALEELKAGMKELVDFVARLLGDGEVVADALHAGFARFALS